MSCNTLDHADSSHTVHVTSCTWHHLPTAPSHLGPTPCAWNLSPQFISLFGPFTCICFLLHSCLYVTYLFMICFLLCPLVPRANMFPPWYLSPFVLPSSSWPAYISLICHVCLLSSYINFDSTITVILHLCATWVFCLTRFLVSGNCQLLYLCYLTSCSTGNLPATPTDSITPLWFVGCTYTCIYSKYLDHNRRPAQHTSWSHCPYLLLHPETYKTQSSHQVA